MSGCHPTNTDPCQCRCHVFGAGMAGCCNCTPQLGYNPIETLQVCKHGRPLKFGCTQCYCDQFQSHAPEFDKVEENVSPMVKQIQELEVRIVKLESNRLSQELDPKVWVFVNERLDKLESNFATTQIIDQIVGEMGKLKSTKAQADLVAHHYIEVNKKLDKLEEFKKQYFDQFTRTHAWIKEIEVSVFDIYKKINKTNEKIDQLVDKIAEIANFYYKEKTTPHKCPVCDGVPVNCVIDKIEGLPIKTNDCYACEGKGIVWS